MLEAARLSTMKFVLDQINILKALTQTQIDYVDFDDHPDIQSLPPRDIIGLSGLSITDATGQFDLSFGVAIMCQNDGSIFNLTQYASQIFNSLIGQKTFPVYRPGATTLTPIGVVTIFAGTTVMPTARSEARPMTVVQASGRLVMTPGASGRLVLSA